MHHRFSSDGSSSTCTTCHWLSPADGELGVLGEPGAVVEDEFLGVVGKEAFHGGREIVGLDQGRWFVRGVPDAGGGLLPVATGE